MPGHGLSGKYDGVYTPEFITDFTRNLMDTLGITRAGFIGHSLGGLVSLNIAFSLPERVDRLVLVDSAGLSAEMPRLYRLCALPGLGRVLMKTVMSRKLEKGMRRLFHSSNAVSPQMLEILLANSHQTAVDTLLQLLRRNVGLTGLKPDIVMTDKLPRIKTPILFVHGTRDRTFPLSRVAPAFTLAPQAEVTIFEDCGHFPHIERAVAFNERVAAFLDAAPER
jgi:pimeloyl-ACP methyl ester carboxylesterase